MIGTKHTAWWSSAKPVAVATSMPTSLINVNWIAAWNPPTPAGVGTARPSPLTIITMAEAGSERGRPKARARAVT